MAWDKAYPEAGIPWDNDNSPYLNETNMGIIDEALKTHDERIIELYGTRQTVAGYADAAQTAEINALAYSNNAQAQAVNSQVSAAYSQAEADRAKAEADRAFSVTPEGYDVLVDDVAGMKTTIPVIQEDVNALKSDVDSIEKNVGKAINLLCPSMPTTTSSGVTCTNNGDGTFTLNGTATANTSFTLQNRINGSGILKLIGAKEKGTDTTWFLHLESQSGSPSISLKDDYVEYKDMTGLTNGYLRFIVRSGAVLDNLVIKPMLTTDINATYDDFVPFIGSADTLVKNVASMPRFISDEWQGGSYQYNVGDYAIWNNKLYRALLASTNVSPANATYWKATAVDLELKSKLETLVASSTSELDTLISNMPNNSAYIAYVLGGVGMILGVKGSTTLQRQIRITYFDNVITSRLKYNSTTWSDWTNV